MPDFKTLFGISQGTGRPLPIRANDGTQAAAGDGALKISATAPQAISAGRARTGLQSNICEPAIFRRTFLKGAAALLLSPAAIGPAAANGRPGFQGRRKPFTYLQTPSPAPLSPFQDINGRALNALAFYGEVVLLNFWATWCRSCVWEMPHLDRLQKRYGSEKFRVVAVSEDQDGVAKVSAYYRRLRIRNLGVYLDPSGRAIEGYGWIHGLPMTYLIDRRSHIVGYLDGPGEWDSPDAHRVIEAVLSGD